MGSFLQKKWGFIVVTILLVAPLSAAATITLSPTSGAYRVGQTFTVRVVVPTPSQPINAVSGSLAFSKDTLQVSSISKSGSIISFWVREPTFSNSAGTISFEGIIPNPGFSGANGTVISINFRVIKTGSASLRFTSGSLLANDGMGTNILKTLGTASFSLIAALSPAPASSPVATTTAEIEEPVEMPILEPIPVLVPEPDKIVIEFPSWEYIGEGFIKLLSVAISLLALLYLLVYFVKEMRKAFKPEDGALNTANLLSSVDSAVVAGLKSDISESIHILERTRMRRQLSAEEDAIIHRLRQNLVDAEKIIHSEAPSADRRAS